MKMRKLILGLVLASYSTALMAGDRVIMATDEDLKSFDAALGRAQKAEVSAKDSASRRMDVGAALSSESQRLRGLENAAQRVSPTGALGVQRASENQRGGGSSAGANRSSGGGGNGNAFGKSGGGGHAGGGGNPNKGSGNGNLGHGGKK